MTREEKHTRLSVAKEDLALCRDAMRAIVTGKKQSYSVGTRQAAAYNMSLADLRTWESDLLKEITDLEEELGVEGASPRRLYYNPGARHARF